MNRAKIFFFCKESKTGISVFLNQITRIKSNKLLFEFYFYKKNKETVYPKQSYFIGLKYPRNYGFSLNKIYYLFRNVVETNKIIKKKRPSILFACDFYSFAIISLILKFSLDKKNKESKFIYLIEINMEKSLDSRPFIIYRIILTSFFKFLLKKADWFIFPSNDLAENTTKKFKLDYNKTFVIPYGINSSKIKIMANETIDLNDKGLLKNQKTKKLFYIGRLDRQKDFWTVLKAFGILASKNQNIELFVVGDGNEKEKILMSKDYLRCKDRIHLFGFKKNIFPYLRYADVFLFSSLFEGFGIVFLEAMASGVPIIATDSPFGPSEILERGKDGVLIPVGDYNQMAEEIEKFLKDKNLREKYIKNATKRVKEFKYENMLKSYENFFKNVLNDNEKAN